MGDLEDYYIVSGTVEYNDDPMNFGRCKCNIPGFIHEPTTSKDAMPWIRPFKMNNFQSFSKPQRGQHAWIMISKTNYNEMWWMPTHETSPLVQEYLDENYDNQPDIIAARASGQGMAMITFDDNNGYKIGIGEDFVNVGMDRSITLKAEQASLQIKGGKVLAGVGDNDGEYQPVVLYQNFNEWCNNLLNAINNLLAAVSAAQHLTGHLISPVSNLRNAVNTKTIVPSKNFKAN